MQSLWAARPEILKKLTGIGVACGLATIGLSTVAVAADGSTTDEKPSARCIAIVIPAIQGVSGNASEAASGLRDLIVSYLTGPSLKTVLIEARLPSQAAEEAKQKGCEPLLLVTLTRKTASHGLLNALGRGANATSWQIPGGGSAASAAARAGAAGGLQAAASMAQSTKAKDEVSLEYRLQAADGQIQLGPRTERRTANSDGEDLLTPLVARAAETIASSTKHAATSGQPANGNRQYAAKPADDSSAGAVPYLDHLKTCAPYTFKYPHPLVPGFTGQNIIRGKQGDKCQVTYLMPNDLRAECGHSPATVQRMTSETAYQQARAGEFNFSFSSGTEDPAGRECHLFQGNKELPQGQ